MNANISGYKRESQRCTSRVIYGYERLNFKLRLMDTCSAVTILCRWFRSSATTPSHLFRSCRISCWIFITCSQWLRLAWSWEFIQCCWKTQLSQEGIPVLAHSVFRSSWVASALSLFSLLTNLLLKSDTALYFIPGSPFAAPKYPDVGLQTTISKWIPLYGYVKKVEG